jgi:septin family protein
MCEGVKSRLQKLDGLTYNELKKNIEKVIQEIPRENMKIYLKVLMKDQKNMYQKIKQEKLRSSINKFLYRMTYIKIGV